jgi:hypothetical protein
MGASRPRSRLVDLSRHPRSPWPHAGGRRRRRGADRAREAAALGVCRGDSRTRRAPLTRDDERKRADRRGRGARSRRACPQRGADAAVSDFGGHQRLRGDSPQVSLPGSPPDPIANQHRAAPRHYAGAPQLFQRAGVSRDRDADPDEIDPRRGARLSGAEPCPPRRVLRPAAVAADLQADPDDRGHGSLRAVRALLPRRGSTRRSTARVPRWISKCRLRGRKPSSRLSKAH